MSVMDFIIWEHKYNIELLYEFRIVEANEVRYYKFTAALGKSTFSYSNASVSVYESLSVLRRARVRDIYPCSFNICSFGGTIVNAFSYFIKVERSG